MEAEGVISPVVALSCKYHHPARFQEVVEIEVWPLALSGLKISFAYTMRIGGTLVCEAESTHCFHEKGRPVALERRFPEFFAVLSAIR
jgi:acyl-CoA thioester hydrolase